VSLGPSVAERLAEVRARIERAGGHDVRVVAVTKGFGPEAVVAAMAAGCADVGENYAQELLTKLRAVAPPWPTVHFIGRLQSNKVRSLGGVVDVWQSLDRASLVRPLARHAQPGSSVLVQVNVSGRQTQGGCRPEEAAHLVESARAAGLEVTGLMAIGREGDPTATRPGFRTLRRLVERIGLTECSMGMTSDLEVAVAEGATMVRVGTALFGPRPHRAIERH
jgi:pyridoxal phosphate enzyme (YggS family)